MFHLSVTGVSFSIFATKEQAAYSKANSIASEVFASIRTVFAYIGQKKEVRRYEAELGDAAKVSFYKNIVLGFGMSTRLPFFVLFCLLYVILANLATFCNNFFSRPPNPKYLLQEDNINTSQLSRHSS